MKVNTYYYVVNLHEKKPRCLVYPPEIVEEDLAFMQVRDPLKLSSVDWRVYESAIEGDEFVEQYEKTMRDLKTLAVCKRRGLPSMLYKRKYLALAVMGLKTSTERHYDIPALKAGMLFNFTDQTHTLTVQLTSKKKLKDGDYRYNYKLIP